MNRRLDRRALFASGAAAALLAASGVSLAHQPRQGGTLRLALPDDPELLALARDSAVFDTLTEVGADGLLKPELAQSWQPNADASAWRFDLRPDAVFHDDRPFGPKDVIASLTRTADLGIRDIAATGAHSVHIALNAPCPELPYLLADQAFVIGPDGDTSTMIGTGPYRASPTLSDRRFQAKRVHDNTGWADQIEIAIIPDHTIRQRAIHDGFADVALIADLRGGNDLQSLPGDLVAAAHVGVPSPISGQIPLDGGRLLRRWWLL